MEIFSLIGSYFTIKLVVDGIVQTLVGNRADELFVRVREAIAHNLQQGGRPANHELQRAVRKAYLQATVYLCEECVGDISSNHHSDKQWLQKSIALISKELKQVDHENYLLPYNQADQQPELLLQSGGEGRRLEGLRGELNKQLLNELASTPFKQLGAIPIRLREMITQGWHEGGTTLTWFDLLCAFFAHELKHNREVRAIFESKTLAKLTVGEDPLTGLDIQEIQTCLAAQAAVISQRLAVFDRTLEQMTTYQREQFGQVLRVMDFWLPQIAMQQLPRMERELRQVQHTVHDRSDETLGLLREIVHLLKEQKSLFSEDGQPLVGTQEPAPLEEFDATSFLAGLQAPGGAVRLRDTLYVRRQADERLQKAVIQWGTTTNIRAPRQTGKTSLLVRGLQYAKQCGAKIVFLDFQSFDKALFRSSDSFLREVASLICRELALDGENAAQRWHQSPMTNRKLTHFLEDEVLTQFDVPVLLAMDEADRLLQTTFAQDFFALVRSWHNRRATHPERWRKLNLLLVISTEPYLLIDDIHQSPFNVGQTLTLEDFTDTQIERLNQQHGTPLPPAALPELITLLGGQPYLTRQAFYTLVTEGSDWREFLTHAPTEEGPFAGHLRHHYRILQRQPRLKRAIKQIIRSGGSSDQVSCHRLEQAGLIKKRPISSSSSSNAQTGRWRSLLSRFQKRLGWTPYLFRCDLYRQYFEKRF